MRKDWDDVAKARRGAMLKPIDEAESLIMVLVVEAMLHELERGRRGSSPKRKSVE